MIKSPVSGKPGGKPAGKRPFKPHLTDKEKRFKKPAAEGGPRKFSRKPADGKFTKKRKYPGSKEDGGTDITLSGSTSDSVLCDSSCVD